VRQRETKRETKRRKHRTPEPIPSGEKPGRNIYDIYDEESPIAVEFRRAYAKLSYRMKQENKRCFLFTSAMPGEGKSTAASLMALTIARYRNTKTVLVDADMRRPSIHKMFDLKPRHGLSEALLGEADIIDTIRDTRYDNLKVVTCGKHVSGPTILLQDDKVAEVLSELKFYFDTVLLDTTPVLPVSDAAQLASETDGVLFVVMAGVTQRDVVQRATQILKEGRVDVMGVIVNNASQVLPYYYSYNYYDYKY